MTLLSDTCRSIRPVDTAVYDTIYHTFDRMTNGGARYLAEIAAQYGASVRSAELAIPRKCLILAAADHGVSEIGISAYPVETTVEMTKNYVIPKGAGANALANFAHADMVVIDVGIACDVSYLPEVRHCKIANGTKNFTQGPAMTREQAVRALEIGINIVREKVAEGYRCFSLGEMGIGNTTSSAAICAAFTGLTAETVTGRGTGISDARMVIKTKAVADALAVNRPDPTDGLDVLSKVGGFELGCLAGAILGAASCGAVVVIDGFNATAAAMIAASLAPHARGYMIGSHLSAEQAHVHMLKHLDLKPCINMGLRLGEGTGASVAQSILDCAISVYTGASTNATPAPTAPTDLPNIEETAAAIRPLDETMRERCQLLIDNLSKPYGSLCKLEEMASRFAGIREKLRPSKKGTQRLYVFAPTVSEAVRSVASFTKTEVQTVPEAGSVEYGIWLADCAARDGVRMIGLSSGNTASVPTMTGILLGAAKNRIAVFLDDTASLTAAEQAIRLAPLCRNNLFTSHMPQEEEVRAQMQSLGLPMHLHLDLAAREGLGALFGFLLMHAALHMLNDMKTFGEAGVTVAKNGPGTQRQKQDIKGDTV